MLRMSANFAVHICGESLLKSNLIISEKSSNKDHLDKFHNFLRDSRATSRSESSSPLAIVNNNLSTDP